MRPRYETEDHLKAEKEILATALQAWGSGIIPFKLDEYKYRADYAITGPDKMIKAWIEIKDRPGMAFNSSGEYWISLDKWLKGTDLARVSGKPFILMIRFSDGIIRYLKASDYFNDVCLEQKIGINGRYDRGDPKDIEPVIYLPMRLFHDLRRRDAPETDRHVL